MRGDLADAVSSAAARAVGRDARVGAQGGPSHRLPPCCR